MPRKSNVPSWAPKGIIHRRGWLCLRPYLGFVNGLSTYGPEIRITPVGATPAQFFRVYEKLTNTENTFTLQWLCDKYNTSTKVKSKSLRSQLAYVSMAESLCNLQIKQKSGNKSILGNMPLASFTRPKIQRIIDTDPGKIGVNRKIQYLKAAWNWALNRYENLPENPCVGVELNEETPRDRYIEDWEYELVFSVANSMRCPYFAPAMELAYLCRARRIEVFGFKNSDVREEGLYLARAKGSLAEITRWSPRLTEAHRMCQRIYPNAPKLAKGTFLIHDKHGLPISKNALDSAWQRIITKAKTIGAELPEHIEKEAKKNGAKITAGKVLLTDSFTFHDIKAKGNTDHTEKNASKHKSEKMLAVYQRKPDMMDATR